MIGFGVLAFVTMTTSPGVTPSASAAPAASSGQPAEGQSGEADEPEGIVDAFKLGTPHVGFLYRYEFVGDGGVEKDAHASTLRTTLSYRTAPLRGVEFFVEAENVVELGDDWYRDAGRGRRGNGVTDRPVVADPAGTDINQVTLRYRGHDTDVSVGRREFNVDDQRFVGAVGWRQHHQTFAAFNVSNRSLERVELSYTFASKVYRIFGDRQDAAHHFLHGAIDAGEAGTLNAYGYLLNYTEQELAGSSTNSFGLELLGRRSVAEAIAVMYEAEYAWQRDAADNPNSVRASYVHLMGGAAYLDRVTARLGWERLGGSVDDGQFSTPLATLHKFNGWADKFLRTPVNGLRDLYVTVQGPAGVLNWLLTYHEFNADTGDAHYGREVDWQITYRSPWQQSFALKGAHYRADRFSKDTTKLWLWTNYTF